MDFLNGLLLVFFAELGDKSQILTISFATKYPAKKILIGVAIGAFLNHGIAIFLGSVLTQFIDINILATIAGFTFILFSLIGLASSDKVEEEKKNKYGVIVTVALTFFLGELGDKTQLTAIVLATQSKSLILTLLSTVTAMVLSSVVAILIGSKLKNKVQNSTIKYISSLVFLIFGILKLVDVLEAKYLTLTNILLFAIVYIIIAYLIFRRGNCEST